MLVLHFKIIETMRRVAFICFWVSLTAITIAAQEKFWTRHYNSDNGGLNEYVYGLRQDSLGLLWIYTHGGLYSFDGNRFVCHSDSAIRPISGFHWQPQTDREKEALQMMRSRLRDNSNDKIRCSLTDRDGNLWIGTNSGLWMMEGRCMPFRHLFMNEEVLCLFRSRSGQLWMTTRTGIVCMLDNDLKPVSYLTDSGNWSSSPQKFGSVVMHITESKDGSLWLSARYDGLIRLTPRAGAAGGFDILRLQDDGTNDGGLHALVNVYSTSFDESNRLWAMDLKSGVTLLTSKEGRQQTVNLNTLLGRQGQAEWSRRFRCILKLTPDTWLLGSDDGMYMTHPSQWSSNKAAQYQKFVHIHGDKTSLGGNAVQTMCCDRKGNVYIGTSGGGLSVTRSANFSHGSATFRVMRKKTENIPSDVIYALTEDNKGRIWGFCENGFFMVTQDPQNGRQLENLTISPFTLRNDGEWPRMSIGNALLLKDGRILKGTLNGLICVNTDSLCVRSTKHPIYTEVQYKKADGQDEAVAMADTVKLPIGTHSFTLYCSILDFARNTDFVYAYRIVGKDSSWKYSYSSSIPFEKLPSGYSVIEVRATNGDGFWCGGKCRVAVYIAPQYSRLLFLIPFILAACGLCFYIVSKKRRKKPTQHEQFLEEIPTKNIVLESFRQDVRKIILAHIGESAFKADDLAKALGISRNSLTTRVKEAYGSTPTDVITNYRVQAATELLTQTELTISEIAYRVGFNDPKYFSRVYRKMTGISPTEARINNKCKPE